MYGGRNIGRWLIVDILFIIGVYLFGNDGFGYVGVVVDGEFVFVEYDG